jgi:serine/threonine protein kinase HipA of HipAB toxin-antitoxin module
MGGLAHRRISGTPSPRGVRHAGLQRLAAESLLSLQDAERIRFLDAFGALIANTDRHFGNLTLFDDYQGKFELAPVYDMLPMLFAPQDGQLVARPFELIPAKAAWLAVWAGAAPRRPVA